MQKDDYILLEVFQKKVQFPKDGVRRVVVSYCERTSTEYWLTAKVKPVGKNM